MKTWSQPGANRRLRLENSLSSALMRIALLAGGAGALLIPAAEAQQTCTPNAGTQTLTCSGAPSTGVTVNQGLLGYSVNGASAGLGTTANNLTVSNVTGPITSVAANTPNGITFARTSNTTANMTLTTDASVNLTVNGLKDGQQGAVTVSDTRTVGAIAPGDVVVTSEADITLDRAFTATTREEHQNVPGTADRIRADIAKLEAAVNAPSEGGLPAGVLDQLIASGQLKQFGEQTFLIDPNNANKTFPTLSPNLLIALRAQCVLRPGFVGFYGAEEPELEDGEDPPPPPPKEAMQFYQDLCWQVPPQDKPPFTQPYTVEQFHRDAAQFLAYAPDLATYWESPVSPEDAPELWRAALVATSDGIGAISADIRLTNGLNGTITTTGDFAHGILGRSVTNWDAADIVSGTVTVTNNGVVETHGSSSIGVAALSQGVESWGSVDGGRVEVFGAGNIHTRGAASYGIYAASIGARSWAYQDAQAGLGGVVWVDYSGDIFTEKLDAQGILAISKGGLAGWGESASGFDESWAGGTGGNGGDVTVMLRDGGSVHTQGDRASAISASSIGGDGGGGGGGNDWRDASRGGSGGNGGKVVVSNDGLLWTEGENAHGIFANSFAGAGGLGGEGDSIFRGRGGNGGEAGDADNVTVTNSGDIITEGIASFGVLAQSVGGIAGNGGGSSGAFSSNAGDGGSRNTWRCDDLKICGDGGIVTVTNKADGRIMTDGDRSHAVFAQSIGGGGGVGGDAGGWFSVSGGDGGDAGFGGEVIITNQGLLQTRGDRANGVFAQSIGGGGGIGGDATGRGQNISISIGGDGGKGGDGGAVTVTNDTGATIRTAGQRSDGIFAQSVGGGGGAGGDANVIVAGGWAVPIAIGGQGGGGGDAGEKVKVVNRGSIDVSGDFSNGIFAQSIGGGGGVGGSAYSFGAALSDLITFSSGIAIGGDGGSAGDGKLVDIDNFGMIVTRDFNSNGILAQSIGGGGGTGGSSTARSLAVNAQKGAAVSFTLAIGGDGGSGGDGGLVDIDNSGGIFTFGDMSNGVFAQSVGGGGGNGGDASAASETIAGGESSEVKVSISLGGAGGAAGDGGEVKVVNTGTIVTLGDLSNGVTAQSVGGGGGVGGAGKQGDVFGDLGIPEMPELSQFEEDEDETQADRQRARDRYGNLQQAANQNPETDDSVGRKSKTAGKAEADKKKKEGKSISVDVNIAIGGIGGAGGDGMKVDVKNYGEIITGGFMANGIFAQSVGGGGGAGGGGEASGSGDVGLGAGLGGDGSAAGNGGEVLVLNQGDITTLGDLAFGIFAQSVGGGGGAGGLGTGEADEKHNVQVNIGGDGGEGGTGGHVWVNQTGDIITLGKDAIGVFAQSVGGGGGVAGSSDQGSFLTVSIGGNGGTGGGDTANGIPEMDHAGKVEVTVAGDITTEGSGAHGVLAQSVGGGGGAALGIQTSTYVYTIDAFGGIDIDTGLTLGIGGYNDGGDGGVGGNGGPVIIGTSGLITTLGKAAHGIVAQSIGGGGGIGGSGGATFPAAIGIAGSTGDPGVAGTIDITHNGSIHALGENSVGIWAQSMDGNRPPVGIGSSDISGIGKDIHITLNNGEIVGGSGTSGAGIFISGGKLNEIRNRGGRISALSGNAIIATDGDDTILNSGLIIGNVGLGGGTNFFINEAGGRFESGAAVWVGRGSVQNSGIISPFGDDVAGVTKIGGGFIQNANGDLRMTYGALSDRIDVEGLARLRGKISPVYGDADMLKPGEWKTMLTASEGLMNEGISIDHMDTLVVDWATRIQGNSLQAGVAKVDFTIDGLAAGETALAGHIQDIWAHGAPDELDAVLNQLAYGKDATAYKALLDSLHPYAALTQGQHGIAMGQAHLAGLQSCPEGAGWANPLHETACSWIKQSFSQVRQDPHAGDPGYADDVGRLQAGQQFDLGDDWFGGYSLGYETGSFQVGHDAVGVNDTAYLGGVLKYDSGPTYFSLGADFAYSTAERRRKTGFPVIVLAESENNTAQVSARMRGAYLLQRGDWYLRPALDLDGYFLRSEGFTERNAGAFNMVMDDHDQVFGAATLSVTGGVTSRWAGALWHPYVELNATGLSTDTIDLVGRLQGAPAGVSDFTVSSALPQTTVGGRVGLETFLPYGSLRLEYEQREGDDGYENRAGSVKLRFGF